MHTGAASLQTGSTSFVLQCQFAYWQYQFTYWQRQFRVWVPRRYVGEWHASLILQLQKIWISSSVARVIVFAIAKDVRLRCMRTHTSTIISTYTCHFLVSQHVPELTWSRQDLSIDDIFSVSSREGLDRSQDLADTSYQNIFVREGLVTESLVLLRSLKVSRQKIWHPMPVYKLACQFTNWHCI